MKAPPAEKQIIAAIRQATGKVTAPADAGTPDSAPIDARYVRQLEEENNRLRMAVADLTLRNQSLKRVVSKKW